MGNSPARAVVDVGSVIADTYTIEALIGRGGMGAVFRASHRRLPGKKVAIKLLHAEITDEDVVARFRREAMIASQLNHPNIVDVTDFNVMADGTPYLVLEYLQGESLAQRIAPGPMSLDQVLPIIRQVGSAIAAAHREGIIHRDLKPQNIFLVPKEVDGRIIEIAKVLDFGISKIRGSQTVKTQESTLLGTPQYMAPEQATGQHTSVDDRTDVFALGAIVYEMLAGEPAFSGANIPEVVFKVVYEEPAPLSRVPGLPPAITAAVARAMAKPAADRFPSVSAFVEALTGQPLLQVRTSSIAPPEVGFAAGSKHRSTGHDAFAQTMGSVDSGAAVASPVATAATVAHGQAHAQTVASSPGGPASAAVPTVPAKPAAKPAATMRRSTVLIAGALLACAAGAAVAVYLATRTPAQPVAAPVADAGVALDATRVAIAPPDAAQVATAPPPAVDAGVVALPAPADAGTAVVAKRPDAAVKRPPRTPPDAAAASNEPEDETVKQNIEAAEAALAEGKHDRAERFANTVINSPDAKGRLRARAYLVHGIVKCTQQNDQEAAGIDLRNLRGSGALQTKLIQACKRAGVELQH